MVAEVAEAFDGEDPALPEFRHMLDHSREQLAELHTETERYTGSFELPEPDEDEGAWVRKIMEQEAEE